MLTRIAHRGINLVDYLRIEVRETVRWSGGRQKRPRVYFKGKSDPPFANTRRFCSMTPRYSPHFTLAAVHRQPVAVAFDSPPIVSDTGLLTVRSLDQGLGYLADLARRLPDPRAQRYVTHSA